MRTAKPSPAPPSPFLFRDRAEAASLPTPPVRFARREGSGWASRREGLPVTSDTSCAPPPPETAPAHEWADDAVLCPCAQATKGAVARAVLDGHASLASLGHVTKAGTEP